MSRRPAVLLGVAAAGGVGYYLYSAGGDPKVAEKKFEADASKMVPGSRHTTQRKAEATASSIGSQVDQATAEARAKMDEAKARAEQLEKEGLAKFDASRKEAEVKVNAAVDNFDKTVERKAAEAKSGISSWFGFGK